MKTLPLFPPLMQSKIVRRKRWQGSWRRRSRALLKLGMIICFAMLEVARNQRRMYGGRP
jgi:hypothetical protein